MPWVLIKGRNRCALRGCTIVGDVRYAGASSRGSRVLRPSPVAQESRLDGIVMAGAELHVADQGAGRFNPSQLEALRAVLGPRAHRNVSLAPYTAIRVGGLADLLLVAESADELVRAIDAAREHGVPWSVLGGGCNVLVADQGLPGLVIINRAHAVSMEGDQVWAESGTKLAALVHRTVDAGLGGLAWAAGLPGTVGGAIVGNAGAFGGEVSTSLHSAAVLEPNGEVVQRSSDWFDFDYRHSRLKGRRGQGRAVLSATFSLEPSDRATLRSRAAAVLEERRQRHPAGLTMGSTFKNPPGQAAGELIDRAGLKGYRVGGARVSEQHANFLINAGDATAQDVLALIEHVRAVIDRLYGVKLALEVELLGWSGRARADRGGPDGS